LIPRGNGNYQEDKEILSGAIGSAFDLKEGMRFDSQGKWELPKLMEDRLGVAPQVLPEVAHSKNPKPGGILLFGGVSPESASPNPILCFYSDDYRWQSAFDDTATFFKKVLRTKPAGFIGFDFSNWNVDPFPCRLWSLYRSRWCSRYAQELGLWCWPNLQWDRSNIEESLDGFPVGAPYVVRQFHTKNLENAETGRIFLKDFEKALKVVEPQALGFYGNPDKHPKTWELCKNLVGRVDAIKPYEEIIRDRRKKNG